MAYCEHCGYRIPRGEEECGRCGHLDFTYVDDDAMPIDPDEVKWADTGEYVIEANWRWSSVEYIAIEDPDDVDNVLAHEPDREDPSGFFGLLPFLGRGKD